MSVESEFEKVISYVFVWHSFLDVRSCRKCVALNGKEYRNQDLFAPVLIDPQFGPVWDLNLNRSLMHGASGTCRCSLEVIVERIDLNQWDTFQNLNKFLEKAL